MEQAQSVLTAFLSPENSVRKGAEDYIQNINQTDFTGGLQFFMAGIKLQQHELAELSALLFKKKYFDVAEDMNKIPMETLKSIHNELSTMLNPAYRLIFLKRLCDILVIIHNHLNSYEDLMKIINGLSSSTESSIKQVILYILELLCEYCFDEVMLKSHTQFLTTIFSQYMQDGDYNVRVAAIKATSSFMSSIEDNKFAKQFSSIIPILLENTVQSIKQDQLSGKECIESMGDLIESQPKLVKDFVGQFLDILTQIMELNTFEESLRKSAITAIVALCSKNALTVRKSQIFSSKTLPALIRMLTEMEEKDMKAWESDLFEEIASKNDISGVSQGALAQINSSLGVKFVLPLCVGYIQELLASNNWMHRQAGLMAISVIVEGAAEHFTGEMDGLMVLISKLMDDSNPVIIWSILTCLAILCTEYSPKIQQKYHQQIMGFIIMHLKNDSMKIRHRSLASIINFCQGMNENEEDSTIVKNYATPILSSLQFLLEDSISNNRAEILENVLNSLSTVVVILQDSFSEYYSAFMPNLKKTLITCPAETPQQINIRVHTIECVGYLANSMRNQPSVFISDFNEIMNFLMKLESSGISEDDKHRQAIISVYSQFATCLKHEFAPFLPNIMPSILKSVSIDVSLSVRDESQSKSENQGPEFMLDLKLMGGKKFFTLNTDALELKLTGSSAIAAICKHLGTSIMPYVEQITQILIPMVSLKYSKEIRQNTMKAFSYMVASCKEEKDMISMVRVFLPPMLQELESTNKIGKSVESHFILKRIMKSLKFITQPNILDQEITQSLLSSMQTSLNLAKKLKNEVMQEYKEDIAEADDDMKAEIMEEYDEMNDLYEVCMDLSGKLLKIMPSFESVILSYFSSLYGEMLNSPNSTDRELILGACFFDEIITSSSVQTLNSVQAELKTKFIQLTQQRDNCDVQQSTIYGLGMLAQRLGNFEGVEAVSKLALGLIQRQDAMAEERLSCTDNAVGALFRIALHCSISEESSIMGNCLSYMPLKTDDEEARNIHKLFLLSIQSQHPKLTAVSPEIVNSAVANIRNFASTPEGNDVLDDEGRQLLQKI